MFGEGLRPEPLLNSPKNVILSVVGLSSKRLLRLHEVHPGKADTSTTVTGTVSVKTSSVGRGVSSLRGVFCQTFKGFVVGTDPPRLGTTSGDSTTNLGPDPRRRRGTGSEVDVSGEPKSRGPKRSGEEEVVDSSSVKI